MINFIVFSRFTRLLQSPNWQAYVISPWRVNASHCYDGKKLWDSAVWWFCLRFSCLRTNFTSSLNLKAVVLFRMFDLLFTQTEVLAGWDVGVCLLQCQNTASYDYTSWIEGLTCWGFWGFLAVSGVLFRWSWQIKLRFARWQRIFHI